MKLNAQASSTMNGETMAISLAASILRLNTRARNAEQDCEELDNNIEDLRDDVERAFAMIAIMPLVGMDASAREYHRGLLIAMTHVMELLDFHFGDNT